jgi:hypothetical protein
MEQSKIRSWWAHRQGLDGAFVGKSAAEVLQRAGWARSERLGDARSFSLDSPKSRAPRIEALRKADYK